ncbi:MAG TPA: DUF2059 domain-containing protein [Terriglobales bacterium]|nr:DUF2059 domain-containing protein [Terriglobales bacterium]
MKNTLVSVLVLLSGLTPALGQQPTSPATKQDVEELLTITGIRERIQQIWASIGQQIATSMAETYRERHPDATPAQLHKIAEATRLSYQASVKTISVDELLVPIVPIYQRHLSHSDVQSIISFYKTPAGQKYLKEMPAMTSESMQAVQPVIRKHLPEMQAAAEKAVEKVMESNPPSSGPSHNVRPN